MRSESAAEPDLQKITDHLQYMQEYIFDFEYDVNGAVSIKVTTEAKRAATVGSQVHETQGTLGYSPLHCHAKSL